MNTKRDMLRRTAAFISALTFVSATNVTALSGIAAAGTFTNDSSAAYNMVNTDAIFAPDTVLTETMPGVSDISADITANVTTSAATTTTTSAATTTTTTTSAATTTTTSAATTTTTSAATTTTTSAVTTTSAATTTTSPATTTTTAEDTAAATTTAPFIRFDFSDAISSQMDDDKTGVILNDINDKIDEDDTLHCEASKETDELGKKYVKITYKDAQESEIIEKLSELKLFYPSDFDWEKGYEEGKDYNKDKFYLYSFDPGKTIEEAIYYKVSGAKDHLAMFDASKTELIRIPYIVNHQELDEYYIANNTKLDSESFILDELRYAKVNEGDSYTVTGKIHIDDHGVFNYNFGKEYYISFADKTFTVNFSVKNANVEVFRNDAAQNIVDPVNRDNEPNKYVLTWRELDNYNIRINPESNFDLVKITDYDEKSSFEESLAAVIQKVTGEDFTRNKHGENFELEVLGEHSTLRAYSNIGGNEDIPLVEGGYCINPVKNIDGNIYYLSRCEYAYSGDEEHKELSFDYSAIIDKLDNVGMVKIDNCCDSKNLRPVKDEDIYFILEYSAADIAENINMDEWMVFNKCSTGKRVEGTDDGQIIICKDSTRFDITDIDPEYEGCKLYFIDDKGGMRPGDIKVVGNSTNCVATVSILPNTEYLYFLLMNHKVNGIDKAVPMVPFYIYLDDSAPGLLINGNDNKWTNHKSFLLDINELYGNELDEKININDRLNNIAQITIDDLVFEKSADQNWENGKTIYPAEGKRSANDKTSNYQEYLAGLDEINKNISDYTYEIKNCKGNIADIQKAIKNLKVPDDENGLEEYERAIENYNTQINDLNKAIDDYTVLLNNADGELKRKLNDPLKSVKHPNNVKEPYSASITPVEEEGRIYLRVDVDVPENEGKFYNDALQIRVCDHSGIWSNTASAPAKIECSPPIVRNLELPDIYDGMSSEKLRIKLQVTDKYENNTSDKEFSDVSTIEVIFSPEKTITDNAFRVFVNRDELTEGNNKLLSFDKTFDLAGYSGDECYIFFRVTDNAGNTGEYCYSAESLTGVSGDWEPTPIRLDRTDPEISGPVYDENTCYKDEEGAFWYNTDTVTLEYNIIDNESGIKSVDAETDPYAAVYAKGFDSESEKKTNIDYLLKLELGEDGKYTVKTTVYDNVGNRENAETIVHKDSMKPRVEYISFNDVYGRNIYRYFTQNSDGTLNTEDKRIFANTDVILRVHVRDEGADEGKSSGIKEVHIKLTDYDGKEYPEEIVVPENGTGYAAYTIPVGFKGYIQTLVIDNAGNVSDTSHEICVISESAEMHESHADIDIKLPDADYEKNGVRFYNHDITADIVVSDTHSGIKNISWTYDENNVVTEFGENDAEWNDKTVGYTDREGRASELKWELKAEEREKIITEATDRLKVNLDKNDITIRVELEDNAKNRSFDQKTFSIDKTAPEISISGIEESKDVKYYNTYKTANITVKDRNNNTAAVVINGNSERFASENSHDIVIVKEFNTDGRYSLNVTGNDLVGNSSDKKMGTFVIDTTAPKASISVKKADGSAVKPGEDAFIGSDVELTVLVDEVNFDPDSINVTINGTAFKSGSWSEGNSHLLTIPNSYFSKDGKYVINVTGKDKAGNSLKPVSASFTVDKKKPDVNISGVREANNGTVAPVIIISEDNIASRNVEISRNGKILAPSSDENSSVVRYNVTGNNYITGKWDTDNGKSRLTFDNFPSEEEYDGYYTIDVSTKDRADNERNESISFSVNRSGSVFIIENEENINKCHLPSAPTIRIIERNVDKHGKDDEVIIIVDKGTNTIQLSADQYTVSEPAKLEDGSGYEYIYTIEPKVFDQDLDYNISIQTVDAAGNKNVSTLRGADISFSIDTHEPEFKCDDLVDHAEFRKSEIEFRLNVNERIKHIKVTTSLKEVLLDSDGRSDGENSYVFAIPASNTSRDLTVELIDLAGNKTIRTFTNLLVTENIVLYAMHKTWAKAVAAASVIGLGTAGGAVFVRRRRRKY